MHSCINGATTMPYPLEQDFESAKAAGFEAVEIWWPKLKKYLEDYTLTDLCNLVRHSGLAVASICPLLLKAFAEDGPDALQEFMFAAAIAEEIGCKVILVGPDAPTGMGREPAYRRMADVVCQFAEIAKQHGACIAIETLGGHPFVPGPSEGLEILERASHPAAGLVFDPHHYFKSGINDEEVNALPIEKLFLVHVNDSEDKPLSELQRWHRLYPGEGIMPLIPWFRIIKNKGYQGFVSIEIFREEYWEEDPFTISKKAKASLDWLFQAL